MKEKKKKKEKRRRREERSVEKKINLKCLNRFITRNI